MKIDISEEDVLNLRSAVKRLIPISEPYVDLEVLSIQSIIDKYENAIVNERGVP